jgi:hypothetical protein
MSRFGDTAANTGILTLMDNLPATQNLNVSVKTVAASAAAALFRIFLMPVDTVKVRTKQNRTIIVVVIIWLLRDRFECYS